MSGVCLASFGLWLKQCLLNLLNHVSGLSGAAKALSGCIMLGMAQGEFA